MRLPASRTVGTNFADAALEKHAAALCARGVSTSTFGIGADFNEELLRKMSTAGGGAFYFIERPEQIEDYMTSETGDALDVVARNVSLVVRVPEGVKLRCRSMWPSETSEGAMHVRLGSLLSDQQLDVLFELEIPAGAEPCRMFARTVDADGTMADDATQFDLVRVEAVDGKPDPTVAEPIVNAIAAEARSQAMEVLRRGDRKEARRLFEEAAALIERYAGVLPKAGDLAARLRHEASGLDEMSDMDRKRMYMASSSASRGRSPAGYAGKFVLHNIGIFTNVEKVVDSCDVAERVSGHLFHLMLWTQDAFVRGGAVLDPQEEADCVALYGAKFAHLPLRLVFVASRLHDSSFSHWHPSTRTAMVSVADVAPRFLEAFVAYQVLLCGLCLMSSEYDPVGLAHVETRGCLFDFCGGRVELETKLQRMDVCPSCEQALQRLSIPVHVVREACDMIRQSAGAGRTD